jgi:hypothetical protein
MTSTSTGARRPVIAWRDTTSKQPQLEDTILAEDDLDRDVELLAAAGEARAAWGVGDALAARRWSVCLALLLMEQSEATGSVIWDRRTAVTPQRRAGHDAWTVAWHIASGEPERPGRRVNDLLPLVAQFLTEDCFAAA